MLWLLFQRIKIIIVLNIFANTLIICRNQQQISIFFLFFCTVYGKKMRRFSNVIIQTLSGRFLYSNVACLHCPMECGSHGNLPVNSASLGHLISFFFLYKQGSTITGAVHVGWHPCAQWCTIPSCHDLLLICASWVTIDSETSKMVKTFQNSSTGKLNYNNFPIYTGKLAIMSWSGSQKFEWRRAS